MAELKIRKNAASVSGFLKKLPAERRTDAEAIVAMMKAATKEEPAMWGSSIVGFGRLHYKYAFGREGDWFKAGYALSLRRVWPACGPDAEARKAQDGRRMPVREEARRCRSEGPETAGHANREGGKDVRSRCVTGGRLRPPLGAPAISCILRVQFCINRV